MLSNTNIYKPINKYICTYEVSKQYIPGFIIFLTTDMTGTMYNVHTYVWFFNNANVYPKNLFKNIKANIIL